jgi:hypothetical protein
VVSAYGDMQNIRTAMNRRASPTGYNIIIRTAEVHLYASLNGQKSTLPHTSEHRYSEPMKQASDMYRFSSKLWINTRSISINSEASLYIQVVINGRHKEFPLKLHWPIKYIDLLGSRLKARSKTDANVGTYNDQIVRALADHHEINNSFLRAKQDLNRVLFTKKLRNFSNKEFLISFLQHEGLRRLRENEIDEPTYKSINSLTFRIKDFDVSIIFSALNEKWFTLFDQNGVCIR